jgi:hypothetical protein
MKPLAVIDWGENGPRTRNGFVAETNGKKRNGMRMGDVKCIEFAAEKSAVANPPYSAC